MAKIFHFHMSGLEYHLNPEAHSLPHFLRLLPIPGHLAGAWVQVVSPDIVVDAAVAASPWILILQEADNSRCELTEELDGKDKRYDGNSNSTCKENRGSRGNELFNRVYVISKEADSPLREER